MAYSNIYSKEEQKNLAREKVTKALSKISVDAASVFNNDTFSKYLSFAAKFHYFDVNNILLLYKQRPSATFVATFKTWEKLSFDNWGDKNRPIFLSSQKGKGIGILAPYILKKKNSASNGSTPMKNRILAYLDYHVVFVFDKEQTNDIPSPILSWDLSKSKVDSEALYNAFKTKAPFNIVFSTSPDFSYKYSFEPSEQTDIKDSLVLNCKDSANFYLLCSYVVKPFVTECLKDSRRNTSEDEFQKICECVSYMISSYFGLPTEQYVFFFVRFWGNNDFSKKLSILNVIQSSAHKLIDLLEEEMFFYKDIYGDTDLDMYDNNDILQYNAIFDF